MSIRVAHSAVGSPTVLSRVVVSVTVVSLFGACGGDARDSDEAPGSADAAWALTAMPQSSGTDALLQAVSPVDEEIVWVSGHQATWAVTSDGGQTWSASIMEGEESLQFRDVEAFDASTAYLMSAGTGEQSRIYRTDDGGATWALQYQATHAEAFFDCMAFWDRDRGLLFGDETDGVLFVLRTENGGESWTRVPADALPVAQEGEGGFAASGTCIVTGPDGTAWISAGNAERSRVLMTSDWGASWTSVDVPVVGGAGSGLATIQMADDGRGVALGGSIGNDTIWTDNVVSTRDAGVSWTLAGRPVMSGPVYGSALVVDGAQSAVVAVGPEGMNWSDDFGVTWEPADTLTYWAVAFAGPGAGWAVGPQGRIVRLGFEGR